MRELVHILRGVIVILSGQAIKGRGKTDAGKTKKYFRENKAFYEIGNKR